jgi:hypothetical protein
MMQKESMPRDSARLGMGTVVFAADEPAPQPTPDDKDKPGEPKLFNLYAEEPAPQPMPDDKDKPGEPKLLASYADEPAPMPAPDDKDKPGEPKFRLAAGEDPYFDPRRQRQARRTEAWIGL